MLSPYVASRPDLVSPATPAYAFTFSVVKVRLATAFRPTATDFVTGMTPSKDLVGKMSHYTTTGDRQRAEGGRLKIETTSF